MLKITIRLFSVHCVGFIYENLKTIHTYRLTNIHIPQMICFSGINACIIKWGKITKRKMCIKNIVSFLFAAIKLKQASHEHITICKQTHGIINHLTAKRKNELVPRAFKRRKKNCFEIPIGNAWLAIKWIEISQCSFMLRNTFLVFFKFFL